MHLSQAFYDKGETEARAVQVTRSVGLRCQLGQGFQKLVVAQMCQAGLLGMGGQVLVDYRVVADSCLYIYYNNLPADGSQVP